MVQWFSHPRGVRRQAWRTGIEAPLRQWLQWHHGVGEPWQHDFYRCHGCRRVVTWTSIHQGGCDCGISNKLSPTRVRFVEKCRLLVLPWTV